MAQVGTPEGYGKRVLWNGIVTPDDNDITLETTDVSMYDMFQLTSSAGALDVFVSLDGIAFTTAPLSLVDQGATSTAPVLLTAPLRMYGFSGIYRAIRVRQNGATDTAGVQLLISRIGN